MKFNRENFISLLDKLLQSDEPKDYESRIFYYMESKGLEAILGRYGFDDIYKFLEKKLNWAENIYLLDQIFLSIIEYLKQNQETKKITKLAEFLFSKITQNQSKMLSLETLLNLLDFDNILRLGVFGNRNDVISTISLLQNISRCDQTPVKYLETIITYIDKNKPTGTGLLDYGRSEVVLKELITNPNLTPQMINQIIVLINEIDSDYEIKFGQEFIKNIQRGTIKLATLGQATLDVNFKISPETWKSIVNHPNTDHSSIGQIYAKADEKTKKILLDLYTDLSAFTSENPDTILATESIRLIQKLPQQMHKDLQKKLEIDSEFKQKYLYLRNYWFRNYYPKYFKNKTLPADTTKWLPIEPWIPALWEVSDRTRSNYLPPDNTTGMTEYVVSPFNEAMENDTTSLFNLTKKDSIPRLLLLIKENELNMGDYKLVPIGPKTISGKILTDTEIELFQVLKSITIEIDRAKPDTPVLIFKCKIDPEKSAYEIIKFFQKEQVVEVEEKDADGNTKKVRKTLQGVYEKDQLIEFKVADQSELDELLKVKFIEWGVLVDVNYYKQDDRDLMTKAINDKLTAFRDKIQSLFEKLKNAKIEAEKTYFKKALETDVKQFAAELLKDQDLAEAEIRELLKMLNIKLSDPNFLADAKNKTQLDQFEQDLAQREQDSENALLANFKAKKSIILEKWKEHKIGLSKGTESYGTPTIYDQIVTNFQQTYLDNTNREAIDLVRLAINGRLIEHSTINNFLTQQSLVPTIEPDLLQIVSQSFAILDSNLREINDLKLFFGRKFPITKTTIFGGLAWQIGEIKIQKVLPPAEGYIAEEKPEQVEAISSDLGVNQPETEKPKEEKPIVTQIKTEGVLKYLNLNLEAYKNILATLALIAEPAPSEVIQLVTDVQQEHFKTLLIVELLEALRPPEKNEEIMPESRD